MNTLSCLIHMPLEQEREIQVRERVTITDLVSDKRHYPARSPGVLKG